MWRFICRHYSSILKLHLCCFLFIGILPILFAFTSNKVLTTSPRFYKKKTKPSFFPWNANSEQFIKFPTRRSVHTQLYSINKRQIAIIDGAEFITLASSILYEQQQEQDDHVFNQDLQDYWSALPSKQAGFISFITGKLDDDPNQRFLAVQASDNEARSENDDDFKIFEIDGGEKICVPTNTIVKIGKGISDVDAISTAVAALTSVHYGKPDMEIICENEERAKNEDDKGKTVILGGGNYACFTAVALSHLGVEVNLVTTRPMGLKDTPLNPLRNTNVNEMPPTIGEDGVGFSEALVTFDTCIDTLGDEAKLSSVNSIGSGIERVIGVKGVSAKLRIENNCQRYLSTLTRSQNFVLEEGILFARDQVLDYQKSVENQIEPGTTNLDAILKSNGYVMLVPPPNFAKETLQPLLDAKITFPVDRNELGNHANKDIFVRGCSFPDYGEIEIWPQDTTDGASVRYGFPGIEELTLESKLDEMMKLNRPSTEPQTKTKTKSLNPFVMDIDSLSSITEKIVSTKKNCVLFVSAPYCKLCRALNPQYTRMARIYTEKAKDEKEKNELVFAKVSSGGKEGKQITFSLQVDSVPTFILFRNGERYGDAFGATKLPSKKLDLAIEYLMSGRDWDTDVFQDDKDTVTERTKIQ